MSPVYADATLCAPGGRCRKVRAVVDTGADRTVVHPRVAQGLSRARRETVYVGGRHRFRAPVSTAILGLPRCTQHQLDVWISPPPQPDADVLLGHDYLQLANVVVDPARGVARCRRRAR